MKAKSITLFSLIIMVAMLISACGGGGGNTTPAPGGDTGTQPTDMTAPTTEMATEAPATEAPMETATMEETATTEGGAATGEIDCEGVTSGDTVTMLYQWSGAEEEKLNAALAPVLDACGITIEAESTRDQALLDTRVQAGTPPDIAFWNIAQLQQYQDQLIPISDLVTDTGNYADFWQELGSIGGTWYGLPVKADVKSIIWYSPVVFEENGYEVPETWADLEALVEQMVADGNVPWAMGFESGDATGWTGSDFIEDILLVTEGPEFVQGLLDGSTSYDDPAVVAAYETYGKWARDPQYTVGGAQGTLSTNFNDAILSVFGDPPEAMMVKQSGFAAGTITGTYADLEYGTDFDFFEIPEIQGLQGGTDWMMAFSDKPAVMAIFNFLASDAGGESWAAATFDITPNQAGAEAYEDEALSKRAAMLYEAETLVPDVGDAIGGGFGSAEWAAIVDYVNGNDDLESLLAAPAQIQQQEAAGGAEEASGTPAATATP